MSSEVYQLLRDCGFKFFVNEALENQIKNCRINFTDYATY